VVQTLDSQRVSLRPTHMNASSIYKIVDGDTIYTYEDWTFDQDSQTVTLVPDSEGNPQYFSGDHVPVIVLFIPGKPVTTTYLLNQPLLDSITKLNEGTPPVPTGQTMDAEWEEVYGSQLNDPQDTLNDDPDFLLNDPYRVALFRDDPDSLYESLVPRGG